MYIKEIKQNVFGDILIRLTFDGAFQRANLYSKNISDKKRQEFREFLKSLLPVTLNKALAKKKYSDEDHYKVLEGFSKEVTKKYSAILAGGTFRIGNAQKFLNLYWKVSWILNKKVPKPIHCPFDSIIINKLDKSANHLKWTKLNSIEDYSLLVKSAEAKVGKGKSIAEWELRIYWEDRNKRK